VSTDPFPPFSEVAVMPTWLRRTRAALTVGLGWALLWAPVGVLVGLLVDPDGSMDEMWFLIFGYPGFLGGVLFSILLALRERRRAVVDLALPRVAAWGGLAGFAVGSLPFLIGDPSGSVPVALLYAIAAGSITTLSALSAAGTVAIAQRAARAELGMGNSDEFVRISSKQ
jgi:hypothetical protein